MKQDRFKQAVAWGDRRVGVSNWDGVSSSLGTRTALGAWAAWAELVVRLCGPEAWARDPLGCRARVMARFDGHDEKEVASVACTTVMAGCWAVSGFPVVQMGHGTAASLMATSVGRGLDPADVRPPWPGMVVRVPGGLLSIEDSDGALVDVTSIMVALVGQSWFYTMATEPFRTAVGADDGLSLWGNMVEPASMMRATSLEDAMEYKWATQEATQHDFRTELLGRRLIAGVCLWASDPGRIAPKRAPAGRRGLPTNARPPGSLPDFKVFELRQAVQVDARVLEAVRQYGRRGGGSPTVQSLVAGHWKMQAHGAGRQLRRAIHVEPYWRGPLDGPVLAKVR